MVLGKYGIIISSITSILTSQRKSQLAIEYSYQVRSESQTTWVFWIHASNKARFEQSFRDIADQLKLPGRRGKVNIFQLVESWLRDERKGKWICILDNVDDDTVLSSPATLNNVATKPLLEYIPRSSNGFTIITSRNKEVALRMADHKDIVDVKPMEESEALDLLQKRLGKSEDNQEALYLQLVQALDFMPLAIIQAASYIRNRAPRCSVAQYLSDFQKSDREATKLLKKEVGHTHRDWEAKNSILVTWQMSFDHLRRTKRSAADLLSIMSFFDRQGIPEILLQHQYKINDHSNSKPDIVEESDDTETSESDDGSSFDDDITSLRDFSFISVSGNGASFTMHRLVQLSMRAWLKHQGKLEQWREQSIFNLAMEFPSPAHENWEQYRLLHPHVKYACVIPDPPKSRECLLEFASLLYKAAWYMSEHGMIDDVIEMASISKAHRENLLGVEDEDFVRSATMLAAAYREKGQLEEAGRLVVQAFHGISKNIDGDHPTRLEIISLIASICYDRGRLEVAENLSALVAEGTRRNLGILVIIIPMR